MSTIIKFIYMYTKVHKCQNKLCVENLQLYLFYSISIETDKIIKKQPMCYLLINYKVFCTLLTTL